MSTPAVSDLTGDGRPEIVVGAQEEYDEPFNAPEFGRDARDVGELARVRDLARRHERALPEPESRAPGGAGLPAGLAGEGRDVPDRGPPGDRRRRLGTGRDRRPRAGPPGEGDRGRVVGRSALRARRRRQVGARSGRRQGRAPALVRWPVRQRPGRYRVPAQLERHRRAVGGLRRSERRQVSCATSTSTSPRRSRALATPRHRDVRPPAALRRPARGHGRGERRDVPGVPAGDAGPRVLRHARDRRRRRRRDPRGDRGQRRLHAQCRERAQRGPRLAEADRRVARGDARARRLGRRRPAGARGGASRRRAAGLAHPDARRTGPTSGPDSATTSPTRGAARSLATIGAASRTATPEAVQAWKSASV